VPCRAAVGKGRGAAQLASDRGTRSEGGLMPLTDGLAAVEGPRSAGAAERGVGAAPPKRPTGREFRKAAAYTSAHMGRGPDSESTHFSGSWEWCWMAGRWWRTPKCRAKTRNGKPCRAAGIGRGGRCRNQGGASTGPKTRRQSSVLRGVPALLGKAESGAHHGARNKRIRGNITRHGKA
jgi:hypothetical protein